MYQTFLLALKIFTYCLTMLPELLLWHMHLSSVHSPIHKLIFLETKRIEIPPEICVVHFRTCSRILTCVCCFLNMRLFVLKILKCSSFHNFYATAMTFLCKSAYGSIKSNIFARLLFSVYFKQVCFENCHLLSMKSFIGRSSQTLFLLLLSPFLIKLFIGFPSSHKLVIRYLKLKIVF